MNLLEKLNAVATMFVTPGSQFSIPALLVALCVAVGFLYFKHKRRRGGASLKLVLRALFSKRVWLSRSSRADLIYFFINTLALGGLIGWGVVSGQWIAKIENAALIAHFGARAPIEAPEFALRAAATLLLFLAYEFGYWLDHYLKHRVPFLWEFHKVHHSAEVLTPLTVFRVHPVDMLVFADVVAITTGLVFGLSSYVLGADTPIYAISGTNVILVVFLYLYVHLQHSQVWIAFGGPLGRLFMSPAHHQIHHSADERHYNRNMGSCLALWDWMFGTLEVPAMDSPRLKFGVAGAGDDPHELTNLLITPFFSALGVSRPSAPNVAPRPASEQAPAA